MGSILTGMRRSMTGILLAIPAVLLGQSQALAANYIESVQPLIGTGPSTAPNPVPGGAGGSTIPGPLAPFGMIQFSPDTDIASPSGYGYDGTRIEQFSLTHFNGAGCPNGEEIGILPFVGELGASPAGAWTSYASRFAHAEETAAVAYYRATLQPSGTIAELTATPRTGMARWTFPRSGPAFILLNPSRSATGVRASSFEIDGARITGRAEGGGFCGSDTRVEIHFVIEFDRAPQAIGAWRGDSLLAGDDPRAPKLTVSGRNTGAWLRFDTAAEPIVRMKVALSYVDLDNAAANLAGENPGWDFDAVRAATAEAWAQVLGRVAIEGATAEDQTKFYTALYHVFSNPNIYSDLNGEYRGFDGQVHRAEGWTNYQNFSGWDIIRSWTHLIGAVAPEGPEIVRSMVQGGVEAGLLPFWSDRNMETQVMVGDPGTINVANAHAMGVRGFDQQAALDLMLRSAEDPAHTQRYRLADWIERHHVPGNAAITLEYAMADFALSRYADALGRPELSDRFLERSGWWRESWNPETGYIEPRGSEAEVARIYEVEIHAPSPTGVPGDLGPNLALHRPTEASDSCNENESPDKAVNGSWTGGQADKWCDNASDPKWWQVDLVEPRDIGTIIVRHAAAGGEPAEWNTRNFVLESSLDREVWSTLATVTSNRDSVTVHEFRPVSARYVRLRLTTPEDDDAWGCRPFEPASGCGFIEGNAAQYVWMVPHDIEGLFERMGGRGPALARLDHLFLELNAGTARPHFYIGNEPEHGTPWVYHFAGAPDRTRAVVQRIVGGEFHVGPGGLPGNDDLGATSAWLVWAYLGMYPLYPGSDILALHGPLVPAATVRLANGATLRIESEGLDRSPTFVQEVEWNGRPLSRSWISFADLAAGGTLRYRMGPSPSPEWGRGDDDIPRSFGSR
ncbi:MAG: glycoside hydrolase family 92 protein [Candidatus Eisenbacteria bacterium]|nr:glycoside hydrolase family 92 protein [Candidatus Eisenbacteria bacterium]